MARLSTCPVYFQRYIVGCNVRVHVVAADIYATEITSDAVDYRRHVQRMAPVALPGRIADACRAVTEALGLLLAGIDLIRAPDGEWYFLEANTSPGFTFFPEHDRVAAAIARLLASPPGRHNPQVGVMHGACLRLSHKRRACVRAGPALEIMVYATEFPSPAA